MCGVQGAATLGMPSIACDAAFDDGYASGGAEASPTAGTVSGPVSPGESCPGGGGVLLGMSSQRELPGGEPTVPIFWLSLIPWLDVCPKQ